MTCSHLQFSETNFVHDSVITSTPASVTPLDWLKNEWRSRQARWVDMTADEIVIEGTLPEPQFVDYFAIPGSNIGQYLNAEVKLELFATDVSTTDLLGRGFEKLGDSKPLGIWAAGIDPYGDTVFPPLNNVYSIWLDELIEIQRWKLTIKHNFASDPASNVTSNLPLQNTSGIVSLESNNGAVIVIDAGLDTWSIITESGPTGSKAQKKLGGYHTSASESPRLDFPFYATQDGVFTVYARMMSDVADHNSIYSIFDGLSQASIYPDLVGSGYVWKPIRNISLTSGNAYTFSIAGRHSDVRIDKLIIQPSGLAEPTGIGDGQSSTTAVNTSTTNNVEVRMLMIGRSARIEKNFEYGSIIQFLTAPSLYQTINGFSVPGFGQSEVRSLELSLPAMTDGDRFMLWHMEKTLKGDSFLLNAYPDRNRWMTGNYQFLARFGEALKFSHTRDGRHATRLSLIEA